MVEAQSLIPWIIAGWILGSILGSFFNVLIYRIPRGISVIAPRSFCPHCQANIPWYQNLPVLYGIWNTLFQKGKSPCCSNTISSQYLIVEVLSGVLGGGLALLLWQTGPSLLFWTLAIWCFLSIPIIWIDVQHYLIPNNITYPGIGIGMVLLFTLGTWNTSFMVHRIISSILFVVGLFLFRGIANYWFKRDSFGIGDIKLLGVGSLFFGWDIALQGLYMASLIACFCILPAMLLGWWNRSKPIPFGPFLCVGVAVPILFQLIWGLSLWEYYLQL